MQRSKASITAAKVARLASLDALYHNTGLFPQDYLDTMVVIQREAGILRPLHHRIAASATFQSVMRTLDSRFFPGSMAHISLRKRYVLEQTKAAIAAGSRCVINLGAGFDALTAYLAHQFPNVQFCEIDHPVTSHDKVHVLNTIGNYPANLRLIPADLARVSLAETIERAKIVLLGAPTTFIAEGLLMYLPDEAVVDTFRDMVTAAHNELRVIFTYLPLDREARPMIGNKFTSVLTRATLRLFGEPMLWGCNPEDMADFLAPFQLRFIDSPSATEVAARFLEERVTIPTVEWFATVENADETH